MSTKSWGSKIRAMLEVATSERGENNSEKPNSGKKQVVNHLQREENGEGLVNWKE